MTTIGQHIYRYFRDAGSDNPKFYSAGDSNVYAERRRWVDTVTDVLYSYGRHFPLVQLMPSADGNPRGWWLVNGDNYSPTTSRHQSDVRSAVRQTGMPSMLVPFSCLNAAGIRYNTIVPVEVLPDRYEWEPRTRKEPPADWQLEGRDYGTGTRNWRQQEDGTWAYETQVHHLGEAVFRAVYTERTVYTERSGTAYFLSAFDRNERDFGLYFLCQLPDGAQPQTVAEAIEALKPDLVKRGEAEGREVLRQGDVFAIASDRTTRYLPGPSQRSAYVLEVSHVATEVRRQDERTYARGVLRHRPRESWRRPEHRNVPLGDRKTWYLLVKNTVPPGRAWARAGNVD